MITPARLVPNARLAPELLAWHGHDRRRDAGQGSARATRTLIACPDAWRDARRPGPSAAGAATAQRAELAASWSAKRPPTWQTSSCGSTRRTASSTPTELAGRGRGGPGVAARAGPGKVDGGRRCRNGRLLDLGGHAARPRNGSEQEAAGRLHRRFLPSSRPRRSSSRPTTTATATSTRRRRRPADSSAPCSRRWTATATASFTEKEVIAYLEHLQKLQTRAQAACVTLVVTDQSRGLFDLLDANRDGRLSVREMRGAVKLLGQLDRDGKGYLTKADVPRQLPADAAPRPGGAGGLNGAGGLRGPVRRRRPGRCRSRTRQGPLWFRKMDRNRDGDVSPQGVPGHRRAVPRRSTPTATA